MTVEEALVIVEALSVDCDPQTGEEMPASHLICRNDVADALVTLSEALHVVRAAVETPRDIEQPSSNEDLGESMLDAYEAVTKRFNIDAVGEPPHFGSPGWFYVGPAVTSCPTCDSETEAFRRPYNNTSRR